MLYAMRYRMVSRWSGLCIWYRGKSGKSVDSGLSISNLDLVSLSWTSAYFNVNGSLGYPLCLAGQMGGETWCGLSFRFRVVVSGIVSTEWKYLTCSWQSSVLDGTSHHPLARNACWKAHDGEVWDLQILTSKSHSSLDIAASPVCLW